MGSSNLARRFYQAPLVGKSTVEARQKQLVEALLAIDSSTPRPILWVLEEFANAQDRACYFFGITEPKVPDPWLLINIEKRIADAATTAALQYKEKEDGFHKYVAWQMDRDGYADIAYMVDPAVGTLFHVYWIFNGQAPDDRFSAVLEKVEKKVFGRSVNELCG